jgi:hypothetical protein
LDVSTRILVIGDTSLRRLLVVINDLVLINDAVQLSNEEERGILEKKGRA